MGCTLRRHGQAAQGVGAVSIQPDLDALNAARVVDKFIDLAALGWVVARLEAQGQLPPELSAKIHHMADEWKAKHP